MKPRACAKCGTWYNPKFQGTEELCAMCVIKERLNSEAKSKNSEPESLEQQPPTTHQPPQQKRTLRYELNGAEYRGECKKCGLWIEGKEIYSQERGWVVSWLHVNYDRTRSQYCLVA